MELIPERRIGVLVRPETRAAEPKPVPDTDDEAVSLLAGGPDSGGFVTEYEKLRGSGMGIKRAPVFAGHRFRLKHLECRPPDQGVVLKPSLEGLGPSFVSWGTSPASCRTTSSGLGIRGYDQSRPSRSPGVAALRRRASGGHRLPREGGEKMREIELWPKWLTTAMVLIIAAVVSAVGAAATAPDATAVASEGLLTRAELLLPY